MLLSQTVIPLQLITAPIESAHVTLPVGCAVLRAVCHVDPADRQLPKSLLFEGFISIDGGLTFSPSDGFTWHGPDVDEGIGIGTLGLSVQCVGFDGAILKARLTPGLDGLTTDLTVEVD